MNIKVLFFAEPHPIRNSFLEFNQAAHKMCKMASEPPFRQISWQLFSNDFVLREIEKTYDQSKLIWPTPEESKSIALFLNEWDENAIKDRTDLINENGFIFEFYYSVLERIKEEFDFSHVVLWSENGAVTKFARDNRIGVIHMELGPTRLPFKETIYFDPFGTNANASISRIAADHLAGVKGYPIDTWLADSLAETTNSISAKEFAQLPLPESFQYLASKKYVVVALQLADDLNTILHSPFESPRSFLEHILPPLVKGGINILIKGHPAVSSRPFNLIKETEALHYAEKLSEQVTILDRKLPSTDFIPICANATAVLSINSSVSFESWLIGTPGLVFGYPLYDVDSDLFDISQNFLEKGTIEKNNINKIYSLLFQNYLVPSDSVYSSSVLSKIITSYPFDGSAVDYVKWLVENIDHTSRLLIAESDNAEKYRQLISRAINAENGTGKFRYHIDKKTLDGSILDLKGWVGRIAERNAHPSRVALVCNNRVLSISSLYERKDVCKVHPHISINNGFALSAHLPLDADFSSIRLVVLIEDSAYSIPLFANISEGPKPDSTVKHAPPLSRSVNLLSRIANRLSKSESV